MRSVRNTCWYLFCLSAFPDVSIGFQALTRSNSNNNASSSPSSITTTHTSSTTRLHKSSPAITGDQHNILPNPKLSSRKKMKRRTISSPENSIIMKNKISKTQKSLLSEDNQTGRQPYMTFEEECELVHKVKALTDVVEVREALEERLNRVPHEYEFALELYGADVANMDATEVKRRLKMINELRRVISEGQEAQSKLVSAHIGLVISIAKKYQSQGILQLADLVQEGNLGLIEAIKRFDPSKGFRFSTYSRWWVRHFIGRCITKNSRVIRLPAHVHTMIRKTEKTKREFTKMVGREPTIPELAHELQIPVEKLQLYSKSSNQVLSLEMPLDSKPNGQDKRVLMDTIQSDSPSPEDHMEYALLRKDIFAVIDELNKRERQVLVLRFGLDDQIPRSIDEVASIMNISRERVRTMESKALNRLRHPLRNYKLKEYVGCSNQPESQRSEFGDDFFRNYSLMKGNMTPDFWAR